MPVASSASSRDAGSRARPRNAQAYPLKRSLTAEPCRKAGQPAVHENGNALAGKNEIGFAENGRVPPPAGDAVFAHERNQAEFRVLVPARTDERHHRAALHLGENVSPLPHFPNNPTRDGVALIILLNAGHEGEQSGHHNLRG